MPSLPKPTSNKPLRAGGWLLLLALATGAAAPAWAQIRPQKARDVDAAHRRAQREGRRLPTPYKDTHLDVPRTRLDRGAGDQPRPAGADAMEYRNGAPVNPKNKKSFLGLNRKKK
ncbi:hypothetical protein [Hymenobacter coccineus]|uniref:Uncharacterized protein n=1 Tax=Hymenobacter coccineus TaxID=1908235 RepID=A0A1G1TF27_9BACT|nr:hypothetical protein [Hymenobacter coccineus]OGX89482.1 hypothetical protein BEN49_24870 [Hymenobacter coccineus]